MVLLLAPFSKEREIQIRKNFWIVIRVVVDIEHYLNKGVAIGKFLWSIHWTFAYIENRYNISLSTRILSIYTNDDCVAAHSALKIWKIAHVCVHVHVVALKLAVHSSEIRGVMPNEMTRAKCFKICHIL